MFAYGPAAHGLAADATEQFRARGLVLRRPQGADLECCGDDPQGRSDLLLGQPGTGVRCLVVPSSSPARPRLKQRAERVTPREARARADLAAGGCLRVPGQGLASGVERPASASSGRSAGDARDRADSVGPSARVIAGREARLPLWLAYQRSRFSSSWWRSTLANVQASWRWRSEALGPIHAVKIS